MRKYISNYMRGRKIQICRVCVVLLCIFGIGINACLVNILDIVARAYIGNASYIEVTHDIAFLIGVVTTVLCSIYAWYNIDILFE